MKSGNAGSSASMLLLLIQAVGSFRADITAHLESNPEPGSRIRNLNGGQRRLLTLIPPDGARGTDLADRAGITKQALGQLASSLEEVGLVSATIDPADRRARIWKLSPRGIRAAQAARDTLRAVETQWRDQLGNRDFDRLMTILSRINTRNSASIPIPAPQSAPDTPRA